MKFLIFEARKENEELYLSGYFSPKKGCESESKVIKNMLNIFQEGGVNKSDFVKIKNDTVFFDNATPCQLAEPLRRMSTNSDLTVKPVVNIRYDGTNEKELTDTLKKMFKDWSKITIVESK